MRIITGKAKGIRLVTLEGETTRPTAERVKEAVFSMLQFDIEGRRVLDLFAGSGQMALEAVSRGAREAVLIDKSREAISVINKNIAKTKLDDECKVFCMDWSDYVRRFGSEKFDIVFLDPPYASSHLREALLRMHEHRVVKDTGIVVCESENEELFSVSGDLEGKYEIIKQNGYGRVKIALLRPIFSEEE